MMAGKLAIVSHVLPPSWSGQAMSLYRLLADAAPDRYCLISRHDYSVNEPSFDGQLRLAGTYHHLHPEPQLPTGQRFGIGRMTRYLNLRYRVTRRARSISEIVRREGCSVVIACSGDPADPPAAYKASRQLELPFYLHAFDDYAKQWVDPHLRSFASRAERSIMKGAAGVIVPNEFMGQVYAERYGVETILVHNPSLSMGTEDESTVAWPTHRDEITIVYTGAIYHAHADAFRNLLSALGLLERSDLQVHVYTAQSRDQLDQVGIRGSIEIHEHLSPFESRDLQQNADILFLPLAFSSPIPEVVRTSAPGKMGEYLASGRPVLVHAPADSYVSWYFKEHDCGIVVHQDDPQALASGINAIIDDRSMRERLIANAHAAAKRDFSLPAVRAAYWGTFEAD